MSQDHYTSPVPPPPAGAPGGVPPVASAVPPAPATRKRSGGRLTALILGWTALTAGVLTLAGLSAYLWLTHEQWVDQNDALRAEALEMGESLAVARSDAEAAEQSLDEVSAQLTEAKSTISEFANTDANASDDLVYAEDLIERMIVCIDEQADLADHLRESWRYTTESLRAVEANIDEYCSTLEEAWEEYEAER
ncbi:hypothetical protein [Demequina activiva]|uniref:Uncharacterized protein n=1 Tax=Demequina activiva TaxID=1582364 RepID=A0A919Q4V1_9MICO|nr:hypothetical protein [Demequina activiva]GIG54318.1 hypothetical protein Dac01nite_10700 [Demequina activiva]